MNYPKLGLKDLEEAFGKFSEEETYCVSHRMTRSLHERLQSCKNKSGNSTMSDNQFRNALMEAAIKSLEQMITERELMD